ncbi:MAG: alkaline phosphatase family protein, partial [Acidobacteriota bacterium]
IFVHGAALWGLLLGLVGAALATALHGLGRGFARLAGRDAARLGRAPGPALWTGALLMTGIALAELSVRGQLGTLAGQPIDHPARVQLALRHGLIALGLGVAGLALAHVVARRVRAMSGRRGARAAAIVLTALVLLLLTARLVLAPGAPRTGTPDRVVVVGLDGLTLRLLGPALARGELPTVRRLIEEGSWGSLLTYGPASSPRVWTTLATGRRTRDHGIDDFVGVADGRYRAQPLTGADRRVRALWQISSAAGLTTGVINWLMAHPPEDVRGTFVSRVNVRTVDRVRPAVAAAEIQRALAPHALRPDGSGPWRMGDDWPRLPDGDSERLRLPVYARPLTEIDRVFAAVDQVVRRDDPRLLMLYQRSVDDAAHRTYKYYDPASFDRALWQIEPTTVARVGALIPSLLRHLDRHLGQLWGAIGDDALLLVVSDHGLRPARAPRVRLRMAPVLVALGTAAADPMGRVIDRVDLDASDAYGLVETPWTVLRRVNLNVVDREARGRVPRAAFQRRCARLALQLRALRVIADGDAGGSAAGRPLFDRVDDRCDAGIDAPGADLVLHPGAALRDARAVRRSLLVLPNGDTQPLASVVQINVTLSGDHDRRGVWLMVGPGVRAGYHGPWSTPTAPAVLLRHLTERVPQLDAWLPRLGRLGLLERTTTLDVAPTVLALLGLPVADDMPGRAAVDLVEPPASVTRNPTYELEPSTDDGEAAVDPASDEELMERLRALGYISDG